MTLWGDYHSIDAIVFVRDFKGDAYANKPATKLQNAWMAGCVPICTAESAFLHEAKEGDDAVAYVSSVESLKQTVEAMARSSDVYARRLSAVQAQSDRMSIDSISEEWKVLLQTLSETDYPRWCSPSLFQRGKRTVFLLVRSALTLALSLAGKLKA